MDHHTVLGGNNPNNTQNVTIFFRKLRNTVILYQEVLDGLLDLLTLKTGDLTYL